MTSTEQLKNWGDEWGGIVLWHRDRIRLAFGPGFVTDLNGFFPAALTNQHARDLPMRDAPDDADPLKAPSPEDNS